ncbi:TPR and ankyrin repeat-containing protein 1 [Mactra antiquata]
MGTLMRYDSMCGLCANHLLEILLDKYFKDPDSNHHLDPEQLDACGDCIFHRIAKCKFNTQVLKLTEMLCDKGRISANYFDKDNKLPIYYITRKSDRRLQYFKMAQSVRPSRKQSFQTSSEERKERTNDETDELLYMGRPADSTTSPKSGNLEVPKFESEREKRKKRIEELVKLLPESKFSIFNTSHVMLDDHLDSTANEVITDTVETNTKSDGKRRESIQESKVFSKSEELESGVAKDHLTTSALNPKELMDGRTLEVANNVSNSLKEHRVDSDLQSDDSTNEEFVDALEDHDGHPDDENDDVNDKHMEDKFSDADEQLKDFTKNGETDIPISEDTSANGDNLKSVRIDEIIITETGNTAQQDERETDKSALLSGSSYLDTDKPLPGDNIIPIETDNFVGPEIQDMLSAVEENTNNNAENEIEVKAEPNFKQDTNINLLNPEADNSKEEENDVDELQIIDNEVKGTDDEDINDVDDGDDEDDDDFEIDVQVFDNLEWEVECTAEVWKTLRDKHVLPDLKRRIVRKVQLLASGDWHPHLCKKLKGVPATINLFEAKFSKGRRIIWELAIAFSPRCSETAELRLHGNKEDITQPVRGGRIYSEIIRVWEIVLDHDKIDRSVQRIKKSHQRGECCIIQKSLRGMKVDSDQLTTSKTKRYPMLFAEDDVSVDELEQHHQEIQRFFPPASSNETEYHILKFYSFSSTLVSHVLQNIETKVDFPFRVTDLEHAIINLKSNAPILLLGRSGTGKTTCCLYRLWSKFHAYWTTAKRSGPLLPRGIELVHQDNVNDDDDVSEHSDEDDSANKDHIMDEIHEVSSACGSICDTEESCNNIADQFDHLHQIFITKNAVLSNEVQKNFRELSHADNLMEDQVQHEEDVLPNRLQDVQDYSYPLFLTSRQLLLMLDASLGPPHFFDRKADGSLKVDPRREITYIVFVEEIWPKIQKKDCNYHPSLVWMEIMSFIKASKEWRVVTSYLEHLADKQKDENEINENLVLIDHGLADTVFAEKSSPADWIKRGEDFMKHSLYTVAAKCFSMGGEREKEKIALAHGQALAASRLRDNPKRMHEEFMCAAELYLQCNKPVKAALCLQNAKEKELAAGLFEKLGQYERAGDIYKRMKRPIASSKCYEQLGNYKKAVDVLYYSENYDMAIDAFKRYEMHIKSYEEKKEPVPQVLRDNNPTDHSVANMSYSAALLYHKLKNKERMLAAVDRFDSVEVKVTFLKKHKYILEAAQIYEESGDWGNVTRLLLIYGYVEKAIVIARKSMKDDLLANTLLVASRKLLFETHKAEHDGIMEKAHFDRIQSYLIEARSLDESRSDYFHLGQVEILHAKVCCDIEVFKRAWKAFSKCSPSHEAGLVECCHLLIQKEMGETTEALQYLVKGVKYIFNVCRIFEGTSHASGTSLTPYVQFYGLEYSSQDKLVVYPNQTPLFLQMSSGLKINVKEAEVEIERVKVRDCIVQFLLDRVFKEWLPKIRSWLEITRDSLVECLSCQAGVECSERGDVDNPCRKMHSIMTKDNYKKLIDIDLLMMEFDKYTSDGLSDFAKKCNQNLKSTIDLLQSEYDDPRMKYQGCVHLLDDLMPAFGHPMLINTDSKSLMVYLRKSDVIATHFKNFLLKTWDRFTSETNKFESTAVMETQTYLLYQFGCQIFNLQNGRVKLAQSPIKQIISLETQLDREVYNKPHIYKNRYMYTVMMDYDKFCDGKVSVTCIAKRFVEAIDYLTGDCPNPFESVMKFSKFQVQLSIRREPTGTFYPDMKHYLFWLEFYTSLAIMIMAKLKSEDFPDIVFFLPSNYFALIEFVQASLPGKFVLEDIVAWWDPGKHRKMKSVDLLSQKLKGFGFVMSGHSQGVKMLDKILKECNKNISNIVLLERFLILAMTFVCNIGKIVPVACEVSLLSTLSHIEVLENYPDRVKQVLQSLKRCDGISDVAIVMNEVLKAREREENVMKCCWLFEKKHLVQKVHCSNFSILSKSFFNETTLQSIHATNIVSEPVTDYEKHEDIQQDEDEIEQGIREKQAKLEEDSLQEDKIRAATIIQRYMRRYLHERQKSNRDEINTSSAAIEDPIFANRKINDSMCGLCNFSFSEKVKNVLETERSSLIGDKSVLNTKNVEGEPWAMQNQSSIEDGQASISLDDDTRAMELLTQIKNIHLKDQSHTKKSQDFDDFKEIYMTSIKPLLKNVNLFFDDPAYRFNDDWFVNKHYGKELMNINTLRSRCQAIERDLHLLSTRPIWNEMTAFLITSKIPEYRSFEDIKTFVVGVHSRLTKVNEKRLNSASRPDASNYFDDPDEEDADDNTILDVVEEPNPRNRPNRIRSQIYHRKKTNPH